MTEISSKTPPRRTSSSSGQVPNGSSTTDGTNNTVRDHRDHGRAWVVLAGAFFAGMLSSGSALTLGVLNHDITVSMPAGTSATAVNMVFALTAGLNYIGGTLSPTVIARIGFRYTILTGAILAIIGYLGAFFSTEIWHLFITLGFITGLGFGLVFTPSVGVVGQYFVKFKHLAATMSTTGIPVGLAVFPLFHHHIASKSGFHVAMLANMGVSFGLIICAFAVKNPPKPSTAVQVNEPAEERRWRRLFRRISARVRRLVSRRRAKVDPSASVTMDDMPAHINRDSVSSVVTTPSTVTVHSQTSHVNAAMYNDVDELGSVINHPTTPTPTPEPEKKPERPLICRPKMCCLLVECISLIAINIFLIITPAYLVHSQGWSKPHAAFCVMAHGVASLVCRPMVLALNAYPRLGDRISKPLQIGFGIACVFACACAYFFGHDLSPDVEAKKYHEMAKVDSLHHRHSLGPNATTTTTTTTTEFPLPDFTENGNFNTTTMPPSQQVRSVFHEEHAMYYLAFAFLNGVGNTFFLAYQPSLILEVFGPLHLTRAFGFLSFIWGIGSLTLYPLAGKLGDVFGSFHYAYLLAMVLSAISAVALLVLVILNRRTAIRRAAKVKNVISD